MVGTETSSTNGKISPRASFDLDDHFEYIAENNFDAAVIFFDSARQTFAKIAQTPGIGKRCEVENPRLAGLRKWAVKGFENYLIFYLDNGEIVEIVRILHAARDIPRILEMEE